jgi:RimJ/RimL family protein N-acetyltransferase
MSWLPADWQHPVRHDLSTGHHLRPIRESDVDIDFPAVMGSRERLWEMFGEVWGWPPATMTVEQDREDLARHEAEIEAHESFNYALFVDDGESELLGCVYVDPPEKAGADADVSWWVVDGLVGSPVETALEHEVPAWLQQRWPLGTVRYPGRELSWAQWQALPDAPGPAAAGPGGQAPGETSPAS